MKVKKMKDLSLKLAEARDLFGSQDPGAALKLVEECLARDDLTEEERATFQYQQVIALDYCGRPEDAIEVLLPLEGKIHRPYFHSSFHILFHRLVRMALEKVNEDGESPILEKFASYFYSIHYTPWWMHVHLAKRAALRGAAAEARERVLGLLGLNPDDPDYLEAALEVADMLGDLGMKRTLLSRLEVLVERRPWFLELRLLVERYESSTEEPKAS